MTRAYDDNGNVFDLVAWEKQIKADVIDECLKIVEFHSNEYDGICWAIEDLKELKERGIL